MAIKIPSLEQAVLQTNTNRVYQDLQLDFTKETIYDPQIQGLIDGNDVKASYNEEAIKNSLRNLFNTKPGQRILYPEYGLDLNQFLFDSVDIFKADVIRDKIIKGITDNEPRVAVKNVLVVPNPDQYLYEVTIVLLIPVFNTLTTINSQIDVKTQSFTFIHTPRNR